MVYCIYDDNILEILSGSRAASKSKLVIHQYQLTMVATILRKIEVIIILIIYDKNVAQCCVVLWRIAVA
jgi:hypothetical protein